MHPEKNSGRDSKARDRIDRVSVFHLVEQPLLATPCWRQGADVAFSVIFLKCVAPRRSRSRSSPDGSPFYPPQCPDRGSSWLVEWANVPYFVDLCFGAASDFACCCYLHGSSPRAATSSMVKKTPACMRRQHAADSVGTSLDVLFCLVL